LTASDAPGATPPSDKRWLRTRERLLQAGFALIGEGGAEGASVDALVARAGISKQTFYNHFADRDQLTAALYLESRRVLEEAITASNADVVDPVQRLARGVAAYARQAVVQPVLAQFVARTTIGHGMFEEGNRGLEQDIAAGVAQGRLEVDHPPTAVMFIVGMTASLIAQITATRDSTSAEMQCREALTMLLKALGCGGDEGRQIAAQAAQGVVGATVLDLKSN
jgi:AcrR family transcriptional regulator